MIFSPDSQRLAFASFYDNMVTIFDVRKRTPIQKNKIYYGGNLSFNDDGSQLEASGRLVQIWSSVEESAHEQVWTTSPYAIDAKREWVTYKGCNVLRLPHNRRPVVHAIHGNALALGSANGRVTFFRFSTTVAPPGT